MKKSQGSSLDAETEVESMEGHCLVPYGLLINQEKAPKLSPTGNLKEPFSQLRFFFSQRTLNCIKLTKT